MNNKLMTLLIASGVSISSTVSASSGVSTLTTNTLPEDAFVQELIVLPGGGIGGPSDSANGCCGSGTTCNGSCR